MNLVKTAFNGLYIVENNRVIDQRGWFEKKFHSDLLSQANSNVGESYSSLSKRGVLRGLHFQGGQFSQSKLVTALTGSFIDIAVDLRRSEATFGKVFIHEVDSRKATSIFLPGEFAHGIYALEDNTILLNYAGSVYAPGLEGGINWSSIPELQFISNPILSEKDANLPSLDQVLSQL